MERFWKFALGVAYVAGVAAILGLMGMTALIFLAV